MSRLRAIETGKHVVVAAINGVSGIIAPDGTVLETAPVRTQATLVSTVSLNPGTPPGLLIGPLVAGRASRQPRWDRCGLWRGHGRELGSLAYRRPCEFIRVWTPRSGHIKLGRVVIVLPTYNEVRTWRGSSAESARLNPKSTFSSWTITRRTGPAGLRTISRQTTSPSAFCIGPRRLAWVRRTSPDSAGRLANGYDVIGEMDADGSHQPEQLASLFAALNSADLGHRLALDFRRVGRELALVSASAFAWRQPLCAGPARYQSA